MPGIEPGWRKVKNRLLPSIIIVFSQYRSLVFILLAGDIQKNFLRYLFPRIFYPNVFPHLSVVLQRLGQNKSASCLLVDVVCFSPHQQG